MYAQCLECIWLDYNDAAGVGSGSLEVVVRGIPINWCSSTLATTARK